jgi:hypothetical protein
MDYVEFVYEIVELIVNKLMKKFLMRKRYIENISATYFDSFWSRRTKE